MIGLYEREDGKAADWPLIADTLFRAAFATLDEVPGHPKAETLMRRVHDGAYNRLVKNDAEAASSAAEPGGPQDMPEPVRLPRHEFTP